MMISGVTCSIWFFVTFQPSAFSFGRYKVNCSSCDSADSVSFVVSSAFSAVSSFFSASESFSSVISVVSVVSVASFFSVVSADFESVSLDVSGCFVSSSFVSSFFVSSFAGFCVVLSQPVIPIIKAVLTIITGSNLNFLIRLLLSARFVRLCSADFS